MSIPSLLMICRASSGRRRAISASLLATPRRWCPCLVLAWSIINWRWPPVSLKEESRAVALRTQYPSAPSFSQPRKSHASGFENEALDARLESRGVLRRVEPGDSFSDWNPVQVLVRDNNIDQALRVLKKKMQREGVFREMKQRRAYEKPSERRTREKAEAIRRARKLARKQAQREGLLPMPARKARPTKPRPAESPAATGRN